MTCPDDEWDDDLFADLDPDDWEPLPASRPTIDVIRGIDDYQPRRAA
ncbi:hypothetical protein KV557_10065 [Kitasatospora aureofaciens]|nr:hypothetical protein [Kitasatospora aureofaciens]MBV6697469.1 hypothetical protein [Kitasatospora aureofaciens]